LLTFRDQSAKAIIDAVFDALILATMSPQGIFEKKLGDFRAHNPKVASSNLAPAI
tara:strand:+ start:13 stop:177 length:165 start_codon:yes stop_codon:yes gene_type:complete